MFLSKDVTVKHGTNLIKIYSTVATNDYIFWCLIKYQWHQNMEHLECRLNIDLKVGVNVGSAIANKCEDDIERKHL